MVVGSVHGDAGETSMQPQPEGSVVIPAGHGVVHPTGWQVACPRKGPEPGAHGSGAERSMHPCPSGATCSPAGQLPASGPAVSTGGLWELGRA